MLFIRRHFQFFLIVFLLLLSGVTHGYNMFHFPYYEDDEGTYMSQAWSVLTTHTLAPYTYWYDHAPAGWLFLSVWVKLTGGFFTFGPSVNSGRVFMLLLHLLSTLFLFFIVKRFTKSSFAAIVSVLFFSLSPLGTYFQRRVLLDNIMVFWILFSLFLLLHEKLTLRSVILSGIAFGIGVLSKENAIFFLPGFLVFLFFTLHPNHKNYSIGIWIGVVTSVISTYFLYALLKRELFPSGTLLGGNSPHVSLIGSLLYQSSRGGGGSLLDFKKNIFWYDFRYWVGQDKLFILFGCMSTLLLPFWFKKTIYYFVPFLLVLGQWIFLMRGGVIIPFYVVPLLPMLAMVIGVVAYELVCLLRHIHLEHSSFVVFLVILLGISVYYAHYGFQVDRYNLYTSDQTKAQIEGLHWIRTYVRPSSVIAIDNYGYVDLHDKSNPSKKVYPYAEWYWKLDLDSAIRNGVLRNSPSSIDLIAMTPQMNSDITSANLPFVSTALAHAQPISGFSTDGWQVDFWGTRFVSSILTHAWESYKTHFILKGRSIDPYRNNLTTSEGQSYALLRAVWMDDPQTFRIVWQWTKQHMQTENHLFGWEWGTSEPGSMHLLDHGSASDADEDIALALLFAAKRWHDVSYLQEAKKVIPAIWEQEVKIMDGTPYLVAGHWAQDTSVAIINPSYLAPYSYRIFADVDPDHNWKGLVDSSYSVFNGCSQALLDTPTSASLLPDWCAVNQDNTFVVSPEPGSNNTEYSFGSFRGPWRIALDYLWNHDSRALDYLQQQTFLQHEWKTKHSLLAEYTHDGKPWEHYETVSAYGGDIGIFITTSPSAAQTIYETKLLSKFYQDNDRSYWEDPKNYYAQNWAWFGTALYGKRLPNLWK